MPSGETVSDARAIVLKGNDVYICGFVGSNAAYWKNGIATVLPASSPYSMANAIFVDGDDIYIAGTMGAGSYSDPNVAIYWKNGMPNVLQAPGSNYASASTIAVSSGNIYIGGFNSVFDGYSGNKLAVYWKNGVYNALTTSNEAQSQVNSIVINNEDIYCAGYTGSFKAVYWKNGNETIIPNSAEASAISVDGTDIYMAGGISVHNGVASALGYWKNGTAIPLEGNPMFIGNIIVAKN